MKHENTIEVILISDHSLTDSNQQEQLKWLTTTLQSVIAKKHASINKMFLRLLKETPEIFLS